MHISPSLTSVTSHRTQLTTYSETNKSLGIDSYKSIAQWSMYEDSNVTPADLEFLFSLDSNRHARHRSKRFRTRRHTIDQKTKHSYEKTGKAIQHIIEKYPNLQLNRLKLKGKQLSTNLLPESVFESIRYFVHILYDLVCQDTDLAKSKEIKKTYVYNVKRLIIGALRDPLTKPKDSTIIDILGNSLQDEINNENNNDNDAFWQIDMNQKEKIDNGQYIMLPDVHLGPKSMAHLAKWSFQHFRSLKVINLDCNPLGDVGIILLCRMLLLHSYGDYHSFMSDPTSPKSSLKPNRRSSRRSRSKSIKRGRSFSPSLSQNRLSNGSQNRLSNGSSKRSHSSFGSFLETDIWTEDSQDITMPKLSALDNEILEYFSEDTINHLKDKGVEIVDVDLPNFDNNYIINSTLTELSLRANGLTPNAIACLSYCLQRITTIKSLDLSSMVGASSNTMGIKGALGIANLLQIPTYTTGAPHLKELRLSGVGHLGWEELALQGIKGNQSLRLLDVSSNHMEERAFCLICDSIIDTKIETLFIGHNNFEKNGGAAINNLIRRNNTLKSLTLDHCGNSFTPIFFESFIHAITDSNIISLDISGNNLHDIRAFDKTFASNNSLTNLTMSQCDISQTLNLSILLKYTKHLRRLNLSNNLLASIGTFDLCNALIERGSESPLRYLNLRRNGILDEGGQKLCELFASNHPSIILDICDNALTARTGKYMLQCINKRSVCGGQILHSSNMFGEKLNNEINRALQMKYVRDHLVTQEKIANEGDEIRHKLDEISIALESCNNDCILAENELEDLQLELQLEQNNFEHLKDPKNDIKLQKKLNQNMKLVEISQKQLRDDQLLLEEEEINSQKGFYQKKGDLMKSIKKEISDYKYAKQVLEGVQRRMNISDRDTEQYEKTSILEERKLNLWIERVKQESKLLADTKNSYIKQMLKKILLFMDTQIIPNINSNHIPGYSSFLIQQAINDGDYLPSNDINISGKPGNNKDMNIENWPELWRQCISELTNVVRDLRNKRNVRVSDHEINGLQLPDPVLNSILYELGFHQDIFLQWLRDPHLFDPKEIDDKEIETQNKKYINNNDNTTLNAQPIKTSPSLLSNRGKAYSIGNEMISLRIRLATSSDSRRQRIDTNMKISDLHAKLKELNCLTRWMKETKSTLLSRENNFNKNDKKVGILRLYVWPTSAVQRQLLRTKDNKLRDTMYTQAEIDCKIKDIVQEIANHFKLASCDLHTLAYIPHYVGSKQANFNSQSRTNKMVSVNIKFDGSTIPSAMLTNNSTSTFRKKPPSLIRAKTDMSEIQKKVYRSQMDHRSSKQNSRSHKTVPNSIPGQDWLREIEEKFETTLALASMKEDSNWSGKLIRAKSAGYSRQPDNNRNNREEDHLQNNFSISTSNRARSARFNHSVMDNIPNSNSIHDTNDTKEIEITTKFVHSLSDDSLSDDSLSDRYVMKSDNFDNDRKQVDVFINKEVFDNGELLHDTPQPTGLFKESTSESKEKNLSNNNHGLTSELDYNIVSSNHQNEDDIQYYSTEGSRNRNHVQDTTSNEDHQDSLVISVETTVEDQEQHNTTTINASSKQRKHYSPKKQKMETGEELQKRRKEMHSNAKSALQFQTTVSNLKHNNSNQTVNTSDKNSKLNTNSKLDKDNDVVSDRKFDNEQRYKSQQSQPINNDKSNDLVQSEILSISGKSNNISGNQMYHKNVIQSSRHSNRSKSCKTNDDELIEKDDVESLDHYENNSTNDGSDNDFLSSESFHANILESLNIHPQKLLSRDSPKIRTAVSQQRKNMKPNKQRKTTSVKRAQSARSRQEESSNKLSKLVNGINTARRVRHRVPKPPKILKSTKPLTKPGNVKLYNEFKTKEQKRNEANLKLLNKLPMNVYLDLDDIGINNYLNLSEENHEQHENIEAEEYEKNDHLPLILSSARHYDPMVTQKDRGDSISSNENGLQLIVRDEDENEKKDNDNQLVVNNLDSPKYPISNSIALFDNYDNNLALYNDENPSVENSCLDTVSRAIEKRNSSYISNLVNSRLEQYNADRHQLNDENNNIDERHSRNHTSYRKNEDQSLLYSSINDRMKQTRKKKSYYRAPLKRDKNSNRSAHSPEDFSNAFLTKSVSLPSNASSNSSLPKISSREFYIPHETELFQPHPPDLPKPSHDNRRHSFTTMTGERYVQARDSDVYFDATRWSHVKKKDNDVDPRLGMIINSARQTSETKTQKKRFMSSLGAVHKEATRRHRSRVYIPWIERENVEVAVENPETGTGKYQSKYSGKLHLGTTIKDTKQHKSMSNENLSFSLDIIQN